MNLVCLFKGHKPDFTRQPDYIFDRAVCSRCNKHIYLQSDLNIWRVDKYYHVEEDTK